MRYTPRSVLSPTRFRRFFSAAGPVTALAVPWIVVLILHAFPPIQLIVPGFSLFHVIILGNIATLLLFAFFFQIITPPTKKPNLDDLTITPHFKRWLRFFLFLFFSVEVFQVIFRGGLPLTHLLAGNTSTDYTQFGIPSINGFINAIYLILTTAYFLIYLQEKNRKHLALVLFLFTLPILLVNRQLLISAFLQITCCTLLYRPKALKRIIMIGILALGAFIIVGNLRTGLTSLIKIVEPYPWVPESLYPLLWVYTYLVTPFNNIHANMDWITPLGSPHYELRSIFPTVFEQYIEMIFPNGYTGFELVHKNLTVSSFYSEPLLDFGPFYAFFFMCVFQIFFLFSYTRAERSISLYHVLEYSVFYSIAILSVFSNHLLYLPVISQIVFLNLVKLRILLSKRNHQNFFQEPMKSGRLTQSGIRQVQEEQ